jgi:hypothetical protein
MPSAREIMHAAAQRDSKDAVDVITKEWDAGDVEVVVLIVPRATGHGAWHTNINSRARLVEALNAVIEGSKDVVFK